jgi:hypothetical protein
MEGYSTPKKMKQISELFARYKDRIKAPQASVEKECVAVISEVTGLSVTVEQVTYTVSTKTLSLRVPSILKNELRLRQQDILCELKNRLGR